MNMLPTSSVRVALGVFVCAASTTCSADRMNGPDILELPVAQKIDEPLAAAARADARVPVFILGRQQLLAGADAFNTFTRAHANDDRLALRRTVVEQLKSIAQQNAAALLPASLPREARPSGLWIVNSAVALLTKSEIEETAQKSAVAGLYLLPRQLPPPTPTGSAIVVSPVRAPFQATGKKIGWNLAAIGATALWGQGITGEGTVIGLIDDAIVLTHSDLINNVWVNTDEIPNNGVDDDRNGYIDDRHGYDFENASPNTGTPVSNHGTFVAGILAGDGSAGTLTGVAPRTRIMPLLGISFYEIALALQYAIENGADVINMSFSLPNQGNLRGLWRMASDHATIAGLVLVSGAGNFQQTEPLPVQLRTPEDIPSVLAVGGVDQALQVVPFSSLGPVEWGSVRFFNDHPLPGGLIKPDVVAFPGAGYPLLDPRGGYIDPNTSARGNSFSSPHAAGAAALLLSANPRAPAWRIHEILQATARDLGAPGKDNRTGAGLLDLSAAIQAVR